MACKVGYTQTNPLTHQLTNHHQEGGATRTKQAASQG